MSDNPEGAGLPSGLKQAVRENASRFRWLGIALIVLGILAILFPLVASVATKLLIGWIFLLSGAALLWHAFQARGWQPAVLSGLIGLLQLAVGVYLAFFPLTGLVGLTLILAVVFMVQGAVELALSWQHRPGQGNDGPGWVWMGLSGLISLALGMLLTAGLPGTALWAIGLLLGINLLSSGISFVALASAANRL
ncbi:HdeD family acid-resistance protein [Aquicoccus sp. SCR17]|nr:HdeD family acid-resistance protein [Carideicomes alvinocaridis]